MKNWSEWDPAIAADFVAGWEGCRLKAYRCPAGVWTIGYGHTGPDVKPGMVITAEQARNLLEKDLERFARTAAPLVKVQVTEGQFIALMSFIYNCGIGAIRNSTLLQRLNRGEAKAADEFLKWVNAGGVRLEGLVRRREAEKSLFEEPAMD